jgi:hypothetical protein
VWHGVHVQPAELGYAEKLYAHVLELDPTHTGALCNKGALAELWRCVAAVQCSALESPRWPTDSDTRA